jgi:hypothetical protein
LVTKENVPFAVSSSMGMRVSFAGPREGRGGRGGGGGGVDVTGAPPPRLTASGDVARKGILARGPGLWFNVESVGAPRNEPSVPEA